MNKIKRIAISLKDRWQIWGILIYCLSVIVPWGYRPYLYPSNNGWALTLHHAFIQGWQFGRDIVFTFGPLGFLFYGFHPITQKYTIIFWIFISLVISLSLKELIIKSTIESKNLQGIICIISIALCVIPDVVDAQIYFLIFLYILLNIASIQKKGLINMHLLSFALFSLVKFSWAICAFGVILLLEIGNNLKGNCKQLSSLKYIFLVIIIWIMTGQEISLLPQFILNSLDVASKYANAMALSTSGTLIKILFFVLAAALFLKKVIEYYRYVINISTVFVCSAAMFFLFVVFKAGYVRNDYHEVVSVCCMAACLLSSFLIIRYTGWEKAVLSLIMGALSIGLVRDYCKNESFDHRVSKCLGSGALDAGTFLLKNRLVDLQNIEQKKALKEMCKYKNIIKRSSVDLFPWGGAAELILADFNYQPRPIFESYSAYSKKLSEINEAHILSAKSPEYILLKIQSIDNRFPTLDDSLYLNQIITGYKPNPLNGEYALMSKTKPKELFMLQLITSKRITKRNKINAPDLNKSEPLFCALDLPLTKLGKVIQFLYKVKPVIMQVNLSNGESFSFSIPSAEGVNPFLLSPLIRDTKDFLLFIESQPNLKQAPFVKSLTISGDNVYDWGLSKISFYRMQK